MNRRHVLSGCSGGGKSTLLRALQARGHPVFEEPGRRVVAEGISPHATPERFALRCLELAAVDHAAGAGLCFYDRSALDAVVWFLRTGRALPEDFTDVVTRLRYAPTVFLVPPWPEIYRRDDARQHGLEEALAEYHALCDRLPDLGYRVEIVPKRPVPERADWIEARVAAMGDADDTGAGV